MVRKSPYLAVVTKKRKMIFFSKTLFFFELVCNKMMFISKQAYYLKQTNTRTNLANDTSLKVHVQKVIKL